MSKRTIRIDDDSQSSSEPTADAARAGTGGSDDVRARSGASESQASGEPSRNPAEDAQAGTADRIAVLEAENQQLRERVLRSVAELENVRRRSQQERQQTVEYANEQVLRQLLPMIDEFDRSLEAGARARDFDSFYAGIELVRANVVKLLERLGVKRIEAVGKPFDVNYHEAILRQPSEAPEDTVIMDVEPGYIYHDRVLRHTKVIVSAGE